MMGGVSVMNAGDIYTSQRKTFNPLIYLKTPTQTPILAASHTESGSESSDSHTLTTRGVCTVGAD